MSKKIYTPNAKQQIKDAILEELLQNSVNQFHQILFNINAGPLAAQPFAEHLRAVYLQSIEQHADVFRIIAPDGARVLFQSSAIGDFYLPARRLGQTFQYHVRI